MIDPIQPTMRTKIVRPGDTIVEARLLPAAILTIDRDAVSADGKVAATGGTQFALLRAGVRSACTFTYRPAGTLRRVMFGDQRFVCLTDEDGDGKFEGAFTVLSLRIGIPPSDGKVPNRRTPIVPVSYRQVPGSEGVGLPRLLFKYSHQDKITGHAYFGMCVGNGSTSKQPCFDGYSGVRSDKLPTKIGAGGAAALATAKQGADVTLSVTNGFDRRPFSAMEYVRWVFY